MTQFLPDKLRQEAREINAFGGYDELQRLLEEAAHRIDELEFRRLQTNVLLRNVRDMSRDIGATLGKTADLIGNAVEVIL